MNIYFYHFKADTGKGQRIWYYTAQEQKAANTQTSRIPNLIFFHTLKEA